MGKASYEEAHTVCCVSQLKGEEFDRLSFEGKLALQIALWF